MIETGMFGTVYDKYVNEIGYVINAVTLEDVIVSDRITDFDLHEDGSVTLYTEKFGSTTFSPVRNQK